MIRPVTLACAGFAAVAGLYLYHVKHQTQLLERNISRTNQAIEAARERTGVLRAEWTLMNDPERLAELAGQFLKLVTVSPRQFTTVGDLGGRLPAARALPPRPETSTDMPTPDPAGSDNADPSVEAPLPLPPPAPPLAPLQAPARVAAAAAPRPATSPSGTASGTPAIAARAVVTSAPQPIPAAVRMAPPATMAGAGASALPPTGSAPPGSAPTGSALGMARNIVPPPVPVGGEVHLTRGN